MPKTAPLGERVIAAFGGLAKMSRATGWPVSTVESWKTKDSIPAWRLQDIRNAALANHVTLPEDFPSPSTDRARSKSKRRSTAAREHPADFAQHARPSGGLAAPVTRFNQPIVSYVRKAGENYALLMSAAIVEQAGLAEGSRVEIAPGDDGRIIVTRSKRHFTLDELLVGMTPEREHPLEDDAPRGEEAL